MNTKILHIIFICLALFVFCPMSAQGEVSSDLLYQQAKRIAQESEDFYKALEITQKAHTKAPNDLDIMEFLGKCYMETKQYDKARYYLRKVSQSTRQNYNALRYLVQVEHLTKRYSSAICYINEMLEVTPYEKELWMKKINFYDEMGNKEEAIRELHRLLLIFPNDQYIKQTYVFLLAEQAKQLSKTNSYEQTKDIYETIIKQNHDKETYWGLIKNEVDHAGDKIKALTYTERALQQFPNDVGFIKKKIGLLEDLGRYNEARVFLQSKKRAFDANQYTKLYSYLRQQGAYYYENQDPYEINKKLVEENPNHKEALEYVIRNAFSKGYDLDAIYFIDKALQTEPLSKKWLSKKLTLQKKTADRSGYEKTLRTLYQNYPEDEDVQYLYFSNVYDTAKSLMVQEQLFEAKSLFEVLTQHPLFEEMAHEQLFNIAMMQKDMKTSENQANILLNMRPDSPEYLLKKADVLMLQQKYPQAVELFRELHQKHPNSEKYRMIYLENSTLFMGKLMADQQYAYVLDMAEKLPAHPLLKQTYLYLINAAIVEEKTEKALAFAQKALEEYTEDVDLIIKISDLYLKIKRWDEGIALLETTKSVFPFHTDLKKALSKAYFIKGKMYLEENNTQEGFVFLQKAIENNIENQELWEEWLKILNRQKRNDEGLVYLNEKLKKNPENKQLYYAKAKIFENLRAFDSAYVYHKKSSPITQQLEQWKSDLEWLESKSYKNHLAVFYSKLTSDSLHFKHSVATLEYALKRSENTYTARMNYIGKHRGTGIQLDLEWERYLAQGVSFRANYYIGNIYFPKHKWTLSVFKDLTNQWQAELGGGYTLYKEVDNMLSAVGGLAKTWNNFWFNARVFMFFQPQNNYQHFLLQSKYYLNRRGDFLHLMASAGNVPLIEKLDFQTASLLNLAQTNIGAGYQYQVNKQTTIGLWGNWGNFKISNKNYVNQYQLVFMLQTRF